MLATSRLLLLKSGAEIDQSYSAQFYDLSRLTSHTGRLLELGRFCVDPACTNPDVIRLAWASIAGIVDREGVTFLFGCTSFLGTNPDNYSDCFNYLAQKHLAPSGLAPKKHAENTVPLVSKATSTDGYSALRQMPPLLKSYLSMGGWVSDHAVIDPDMDTIHVFTELEVDRIPERRKQRLRNLAP